MEDGEEFTGAAKLMMTVGNHLIEDTAWVFNIQSESDPIIEREEYVTAVARLRAAGYDMRDGEEHWQKFAKLAAAIRGILPAAKMIFLTREDTDLARFAAVQSGASAFLHKSRAASEVVAAIRDVARGKMLITPRTIATLLAKRRAVEAQLERLTRREKDVLRLMAEGYPSRAIAGDLGISYTTVRTHIRSLGSKLAVHSKLEAIVKARELGLIS
ncbi:MAG: response regulator transcription factor [Chloroflexi bacterium]|nr:MAG: response regulator transcription factor [Chloroflexota bacterium]